MVLVHSVRSSPSRGGARVIDVRMLDSGRMEIISTLPLLLVVPLLVLDPEDAEDDDDDDDEEEGTVRVRSWICCEYWRMT